MPPTNTDASVYVILDNGTDGVDQPLGIDVDLNTDEFFWVEAGAGNQLRKAPAVNPSGNITNLIWSGLSTPIDIAVDYNNNVIYWTDIDTDKLQYRTYSETSNTYHDLITVGLLDPSGISLDISNGNIFWADLGTDHIYKSPLSPASNDAANYILPITGLNDPRGLQIY